ncbi:MAG: hypothetical protein LBO09_01305 [Candidatus Peribacteria bacterium]|jgi:hypothetical protein|nr:hypothetical protein [Candidatus Peribacteria bacterium]
MKGVVEYISASRRNGKRPEVVSEILSVDNHADEHRQMVVGPQLWKQFRDLTYYSLSEMKNQPAEAEKSRYIYALYKKMTETFSAKGYQKFLLMMNDGKDGLGAITSMQELIGEINDQSERFHQQLASQQQKSGRQDQIETTLNFQPTS